MSSSISAAMSWSSHLSDAPRGGVIQTLSDGSCPYYGGEFCRDKCKVRAWCIHIRENPPYESAPR